MKIDLSKPSRQANAAIPLIIYKLYKHWAKIILPLLVGTIFSAGLQAKVIFGALLIVGIIFGIASFLRYTFYLSEDELVIEKGVFKRSKMVVPFDRIQSINFKQGILHQAFSVVELEIDTAGSKGAEFELNALHLKKANALRSLILAHRKSDLLSENITNEGESMIATPTTEPVAKTLFQLSFKELLKVGLTQNHIKSGLAPFALYFWLQGILRDANINLDQLIEKNIDTDAMLNWGLLILAFVAISYALIAILISLFFSILNYFDLRFMRLGDGFKVKYGLFTKRQITIKDSKIQLFHWDDNLLRKIPKIFHMQIKQASSASVKVKGSSINLAGLSKKHINKTLEAYFNDRSFNITNFIGISKWLFYRQALFLSIVLISGMVFFYFVPQEIVFPLLLIGGSLFMIISAYLFQRKKKIGLNDEVIHIKGGIFGDDNILFQTFKIQGVELKQSPFQRKKNLASIVFYTAAGTKRVPYLSYEDALQIRDYALYLVETDVREWM